MAYDNHTEFLCTKVKHIVWGYSLGFEVSDDVRCPLFVYATKVKGVKYRELGITPAMGNMIENRKRRVSDEVLEKLLAKLTAKDLLDLVKDLKTDKESVSGWARRLAG